MLSLTDNNLSSYDFLKCDLLILIMFCFNEYCNFMLCCGFMVEFLLTV